MHDAITVEHLSKTFDPAGFGGCFRRLLRLKRPDLVAAIKEVSLTVHRNEVYGVIGSNGSGKSTLARVIATLLIPDAGRVRVFGRDVLRDPLAVRRSINRVSVEASFWKKLSPLENLHMAQSLGRARLDIEPAEALRKFGLAGLEDVPARKLSAGQKRRVALSRLLVTEARLWILDEPFTAIDKQGVRDIEALLAEHVSRGGMVVLTSHHPVTLDFGHVKCIHLEQ